LETKPASSRETSIAHPPAHNAGMRLRVEKLVPRFHPMVQTLPDSFTGVMRSKRGVPAGFPPDFAEEL